MFDQSPLSNAIAAVAGTSISPLNTGERKNFHYIENVYDPDIHPPSDLTKYVVPQEGELVFDTPNGMIYFVAKVDWQATLKSTLVPWRLQNADEGTTSDQDYIYGLRGGPMAGEALLSIDYSVRPNVARVDATIMRPGAAYAFVYLGSSAVESNIISAQYDQSLNMITKKVPVKLALINEYTNKNIMTTGPFSVTKNDLALPDGTRAWLVFFDEGNNFIPPAQPLMVQHSSYMKDHNVGVKYVTSVELLSPWFTHVSDRDRLIIPVNVQLSAVELRAVTHYSDGSTSEPAAVNGGEYSLYGVNEYRPKFPGQTADVVLVKKLAPNEQHDVAQPGNPDFARHTYTFEAGAAKGAYSPRIFTYPQWDATQNGYRLQHYLYDLDRKTFTDVTAVVTYNDKSPVYKPSAYGLSQSLIFNINLKDVAPTYESVPFVQHTEIVLLKDVNGPGNRWSVNYTYGKPTYTALNVVANNNGVNTTFTIANGQDHIDEWLDVMYWGIYPSYDIFNEDKAPVATHFDLMHEDGRKWRYPIAAWNQNNAITVAMQKGKTWYINWINKSVSGVELQLGMTGVTVELAP